MRLFRRNPLFTAQLNLGGIHLPMKGSTILLFIPLLLFIAPLERVSAQTALDSLGTIWNRTYGSGSPWSGQLTSDGGFIMVGDNGLSHPLVVRTDGVGDTLWTRSYLGNNYGNLMEVQETSDSGFVIAGQCKQNSQDMTDAWLIRTDANGDTLWTRTYGGPEHRGANSVQIASDGGYILAGKINVNGQADVHLIRTDVNGDTLWTRNYGGDGSQLANDVQIMGDGYIVGTTGMGLLRVDSNGDSLWNQQSYSEYPFSLYSVKVLGDGGTIIVGGSDNAELIRTDAFGDTLWTRTYNASSADRAFGVDTTSDSGFIISGYTWPPRNVQADIWLLRTDASGDTLWTRTYGGVGHEGNYSRVRTASNGDFFVCSPTGSFGAEPVDFWLLRVPDYPSAPINLEAYTNNFYEVTLTWSPSPNDIIAKYYIFRDTTSPAKILIDSVTGLPPDTSFISGDLPGDETYYFRIASADTNNVLSNFSEEVAISPMLPNITINEIMQNPSAVSDADGEWFELYNPDSLPVDMSEWLIVDRGTDTIRILAADNQVIPPDEYQVFCPNPDSATNGGISVDLQYNRTYFTLGNSSDEIIIFDHFGTMVDRVDYDGGISFPDPEGASMEFLRADLHLDNNDGISWKEASTPYGTGDMGTPGSINAALGSPVILIDTSLIDFLHVLRGDTASIDRQITNTGISNLEIFSVRTTDSLFVSSSEALVIDPIGSDTITIRYLPTETGIDTAQIVITCNDGNNPIIRIPIIGKGISEIQEIEVTPSVIDLVPAMGWEPIEVLIYNLGLAGLEVDEISVGEPFTVTPTEASIEPLNVLTATLDLTTDTLGVLATTLSISSNDPDESLIEVSINITLLGTHYGVDIPESYRLQNCYPNPFNPTTTIRYDLPEAATVRLTVYDIIGRTVAQLMDEPTQAGYHSIVWRGKDDAGRDVPSGIYIARMITPEYTKSIKMVLLK